MIRCLLSKEENPAVKVMSGKKSSSSIGGEKNNLGKKRILGGFVLWQ